MLGNYSPREYQQSLPQNKFLNRRTQRPERDYYSRLGYNTVCASYTQSNEINNFSGSSLNAAKKKLENEKRQILFEYPPEITERVGKDVYELQQYKYEIRRIQENLLTKLRDLKRIPRRIKRATLSIHKLSKRTKGKVRDKGTAFHRAIDEIGGNAIFATFTLLEKCEDKKAMKMLNSFLTQCRKKNPDFEYLWVAERQENGNIHFHAIFNCYLNIEHYNALWVQCQYNAGLRSGNISKHEIKKRVKEKTIQEVLNPLDVKKAHTITGISNYITKYVTKNKSEGFDCSAWHCSRGVSKLFTKICVGYRVMQNARSYKNSRLVKKTGELKQAHSIKGKFYDLYYIENRYLFLRDMSELERVNGWILKGMKKEEIPKSEKQYFFKFYNN